MVFKKTLINIGKKKVLVMALICLAVIVTAVILLYTYKTKRNGTAKNDDLITVKEYIRELGTDEEERIKILYDKKKARFYKKDEEGQLTALSSYEGSKNKVMSFSFTDTSADDALFREPDTNTSEIYRGTIKQAKAAYAWLIESGYKNRYVIKTSSSVDIYFSKDESFYRYLVIPEAGGENATVTFSEIPKASWENAINREVE